MKQRFLNSMKRSSLCVSVSIAMLLAGQSVYADESEESSVTYQALSGRDGNGGEGYDKLIDGNDNSKWCSQIGDYYIIFKVSRPIAPTYYRLFTGNDTGNCPSRNWNSWKIYGMNCESSADATRNSEGWVLLDEKNDITNEQLPDANSTACYMNMSNPSTTPYEYFKIEISDPGKDMQQMGEFTFGLGFEAMLKEVTKKYESADYSEVICQKSLVVDFNNTFNKLKTVTDVIELCKINEQLGYLQSEIEASVVNYVMYDEKVSELENALEEMNFETRTLMEKYCRKYVEPGQEFQRGSYAYIKENRQLSNEEITKEITYLSSIIDMAKNGGFIFLQGSSTGSSESAEKLIDKDIYTKFFFPGIKEGGAYVIFRTGDAIIPTFYKLTTANDTQGCANRNWMNWQIYGANFDSDQNATVDADGWVLLDNRENVGQDELPALNYHTVIFGFNQEIKEAYKYFKVVIYDGYHSKDIQMAELEFGDDNDFSQCKEMYVRITDAFNTDVLAEQALLEKYEELRTEVKSSATMADLAKVYNEVLKLQEEITKSAAAYGKYTKLANEIISNTALESSEALTSLNKYLNEIFEPNETFPNGCYNTIVEERCLNVEQVNAETERMSSLYVTAIAAGYTVGADITTLIKNSDFTDGTNFWEGNPGSISAKVSEANWYSGVECSNSNFDISQTITGLKNGLYVLSMTSGSRPGYINNFDLRNQNYSASISANENMVFMPSVIETYIPVEEAIDGENCHISGDNSDFKVEDDLGNILGYAMKGQESVANAAYGGRAITTIVANVTDGTLKLGIQNPGLGMSSQWAGWSNIHLKYLGELSQATAQLNETLAGQAERAASIINYEFSISEEYKAYPNISQALKNELAAEIAEIGTATTAEAKYALVQKFSKTFAETYTCKFAYIDMLNLTEEVVATATEMFPNYISQEEMDEVTNAQNQVWEAYQDGSVSIEEAREGAKIKSTSFYTSYYAYSLITSASQLSSNASDCEEGKDLGAMIDGNVNTFWHSDWHGECKDQYHYVQVAISEAYTGNIRISMTRRLSDNDHPTEMIVWGSEDGVEFAQIATVNLSFNGPGTTTSAIFKAENVKYLRFAASNCTGVDDGFHTYWHTAEFQLYGKSSGNSIDSIKQDSQLISKGIYNLSGQRMSKAQKGLNIIDGKKIIVR